MVQRADVSEPRVFFPKIKIKNSLLSDFVNLERKVKICEQDLSRNGLRAYCMGIMCDGNFAISDRECE